ncbi:uncharacterized protein LOC125502214 [Athalia rosae]|uniref:uncharacterized protein LOC125502214 n=1 Tax=Athalia rosae TaxID=37344 RepID=UPI002033CBDC|nr:uncharacterized protein LOC125502214 [Athalia rosae]
MTDQLMPNETKQNICETSRLCFDITTSSSQLTRENLNQLYTISFVLSAGRLIPARAYNGVSVKNFLKFFADRSLRQWDISTARCRAQFRESEDFGGAEIFTKCETVAVRDPKILVDHKELLVDHAANVVLDQKHVILEHSPGKTLHLGHSGAAPSAVLLSHPVDGHTVIFEHKPVLVDQRGQETNVLIHSAPKTLVIEHKPLAHPREKDIVVHPKTIVLGTSRTLVLSPKSQIHEIIVHRHVPKTVVVHQAVDEDRNIFRSHFGGFGSGLNYGGHGAGHGFHVPVF